jgi:hypothetical protein
MPMPEDRSGRFDRGTLTEEMLAVIEQVDG